MGKDKEFEGLITGQIERNGKIVVEKKKLIAKVDMAVAVSQALFLSAAKVGALGEKGKEVERSGGDFVNDHLIADSVSETELRDRLDKWGKDSNRKVTIWGEEIGKNVVVGDTKSTKDSFWTIDGLDGTGNYRQLGKWPYGPMIAGALKENPKYKDFVVAGIGLPEEKMALIAVRNVGVYIFSFLNGSFTKLPSFKQSEEFNIDLILSDNYFAEAKNMLGEELQNRWPRTGSQAATVVAIAIRKAFTDTNFPIMNAGWQGLADVTRKGNLEQSCSYLFMNELGGVMTDINGVSIGEQYFKTWAQESETGDVHEPIILTKNSKILKGILTSLKNVPQS